MELSTAGLLVALVSLGVVIVIVLEHRLRRILRDRASGAAVEPEASAAPATAGPSVAAGAQVEPLVVAPASLPAGAAVPSLAEVVVIGAAPAPMPPATLPGSAVAPAAVAAIPVQPVSAAQRSEVAVASSAAIETPAGSAEAGVAAGPPSANGSAPAGEQNSTRDGNWLSLRHHTLMQGETELGALISRFRDQPWLECTFHPTPAFDRVRPLFDRELQLLEHPGGAFDKKLFVEQWQRIFAAGVWIRVDSTGARVRHFLLHVHADGTARLRYG